MTRAVRRLTAEEAEAVALAAGYRPVEPYPGTKTKPWRARCVKCEQFRVVFLVEIINKGKRCAHHTPLPQVEETEEGRRAREAGWVKELREAGFRVLGEVPRQAHTVMTLECLGCGGTRRLKLADVRYGRRCGHRRRRERGCEQTSP